MASKRQNWLVLLTCVLAFTWLVSFLTHERQPSYEGKSLSEWVEIYADESFLLDYDPNNQTASKAIRQIGTNALPCLLNWVSYESSESKTVTRLVDTLPEGLRRHLPRGDFKEARAMNSARAFFLFRDESQLCIPPLVKLMNDTNSPRASVRAVFALTSIGPDAMPVFAATLADTNTPS